MDLIIPHLPSYSLLSDDLSDVLHRNRDIFEELRGKSLFITGGTGFFGSWLLESFIYVNDILDLDAHALILTRDPKAFLSKAPHLNHPSIDFVEGDVRSFVPPAGSFEFVIHAASPVLDLAVTPDQEVLDIIVGGAKRMLEFARNVGAQKFLFTSSGAVYGRQPSELTHLPEDFRGATGANLTRTTYGEGKKAAETLCVEFYKEHGLETKIARCFALAGPYLPLRGHFAIANFIADGREGKSIHVSGDGTPFRSYLYAADLTAWLWTILIKGKPATAYNVGSEDALTIHDLANKIAKRFNVGVDLAKRADPAALPQRYVPSTKRARQELGLEAWTSLDQAIEKTISWLNKQ